MSSPPWLRLFAIVFLFLGLVIAPVSADDWRDSGGDGSEDTGDSDACDSGDAAPDDGGMDGGDEGDGGDFAVPVPGYEVPV